MRAIACLCAEGQASARQAAALAAGFPGSRMRRRWLRPLGECWSVGPAPILPRRADQAFGHAGRWMVIARSLFSLELGEAAPTAAQQVRTVPAASHAELFWLASWLDWLPHKRGKRQARQWLLDGLIQRQLHAWLALAEACLAGRSASAAGCACTSRRPQRLSLRAAR